MKKNKSKISYKFTCYNNIINFKKNKITFEDEVIQGTTDNPCRTSISLWSLYKLKKNKSIGFDLSNKKTIIPNYCLFFSDIKEKKTYKYQNKIITRQEFVILLGCET